MPGTVSPQLVGLLHSLPGSLTTIALQPCPLLLPGSLSSLLSRSGSQRLQLVSPEPGQQQQQRPRTPGATAEEPPATGEVVAVGAGATTSGHLVVFTVRQGLLNPLAPEVLTVLAAHRGDPVRGLRFLGPLPLLVSFSSERSGGGGGWRNACMITDVRTGRR